MTPELDIVAAFEVSEVRGVSCEPDLPDGAKLLSSAALRPRVGDLITFTAKGKLIEKDDRTLRVTFLREPLRMVKFLDRELPDDVTCFPWTDRLAGKPKLLAFRQSNPPLCREVACRDVLDLRTVLAWQHPTRGEKILRPTIPIPGGGEFDWLPLWRFHRQSMVGRLATAGSEFR